jgi:hypothetical protein
MSLQHARRGENGGTRHRIPACDCRKLPSYQKLISGGVRISPAVYKTEINAARLLLKALSAPTADITSFELSRTNDPVAPFLPGAAGIVRSVIFEGAVHADD